MLRRAFASRVALAVACALAGAAIVAAIWVLSSDADRPDRDGRLRLTLEPPPSPEAAAIEHSGALKAVVSSVNRELELPADLKVKVVGPREAERVGASGPTYVPKDRTVYFPWAFVERSRAELETLPRFRNLSPRQRDRALGDAMTFVLYHELAHGLIDVLDVPVVGSQEAAADDFAAIFAIAAGRGGAVIPLRIADLDEADAREEGIPTISRYADDHGFSRQRAVDTLCLVYGSAPRRFNRLVEPDRLPESRASACRFTYRNDLRSWRRLLGRWLTREGALRPLRN